MSNHLLGIFQYFFRLHSWMDGGELTELINCNFVLLKAGIWVSINDGKKS